MGPGTPRRPAVHLDGCIWAGPALLPGAAELVAGLRAAGCRVVYVTNSSRERAAGIGDKLTRLGIPTPPEDVLPALDLLGETIRRRMGPARVLALGTQEMHRALEAAGHAVVPIDDWRTAPALPRGVHPAVQFAPRRAASRGVERGGALLPREPDPPPSA